MSRTLRVTHHGDEAQPVIVIDDFVPDPQALIDEASVLGFAERGIHYPGLRAEVHASLVRRFLGGLEGVIAEVFGVARYDVLEAWYSLVTKTPDRLAPIQRLPHFDGVEPGRLALLHFLGTQEKGGTAFYRHRTTGFESVDADRFDPFKAALEADIARHGAPEPGYIAGDTLLYQRIAFHEAKFNRAILYRGNTLHCADIPADLTLSLDPALGRLTINTFLMGSA
jgi:Family of unknown function (DUF6445)